MRGSGSGNRTGLPSELLGYWESAAFLADAFEWVRDVLAGFGIAVHGEPLTHRVRFWSAVLRIPSEAGTFWLKATNPGQGFEGPLLARLGELVPDHVLAPVAVHAGRGWILLPDGGPPVGESVPVPVAEWEGLVAQVARMQRALVGHGAELARAGLPSLLPKDAHAYATELLGRLARLPADHPQHVGAEEHRALLRGLRDVAPLLAELADSGVPPSLQPNDTSAANAVRAAGGRGYRFFDLGDAFWSHPFAVLQVPLRMATGSWPHAPAATDPTRRRLVSAYLGEWTGTEDDGLVDAADRLASLHRCESWRRLLKGVDGLTVRAPRLADWVADAVRPAP